MAEEHFEALLKDMHRIADEMHEDWVKACEEAAEKERLYDTVNEICEGVRDRRLMLRKSHRKLVASMRAIRDSVLSQCEGSIEDDPRWKKIEECFEYMATCLNPRVQETDDLGEFLSYVLKEERKKKDSQ